MHRAIAWTALLAFAGTLGAAAQPARPVHPHADLPLGTIHGNALDADSRALSGGRVRLRDCRTGRISGTSTSDRLGLFAFGGVDPGTYVVELLGERNSVLAASDLLDVNAGETVTALVKLPLNRTSFAGLLGRSVGEAASILAAAASTGVLASSVTGDDVSPR